jgi:hypothetical protein
VPKNVVLSFEKFGTWKKGDQDWGVFQQSTEQKRSGKFSGKLDYAFPAVNDNFVVFRQPIAISGQPRAFQLWVFGDGSKNFLNLWVADTKGQKWQFTFGQVSHAGWQQMIAVLDTNRGWPNGPVSGGTAGSLTYPIKFDAFVVDGHQDGVASSGVIYLDDLTIFTGPIQPAPQAGVDAAALDKQSEYLSAAPGQSVPLSIRVKNTGTTTWFKDQYGYRSMGPWQGQFGTGKLWRDVKPGETINFDATVVVPNELGNYDYGFMLLKPDGSEFGPYFFIRVYVENKPAAPSNPPPQPNPPANTAADTGYGTLGVIAADTRRPPEGNPDLNLSLLGYQPHGAATTYTDYGPADDPLAPQMRGLFADRRKPGFTTAYINNGWDWGSNSRTPPSPGQFDTTVIGIAVVPGESLFTPGSDRPIGNGYSAMVLYADSNQITLKYTPEDSIARGYTVFIEGISVNSQLLALYQSTNSAGRGSLPALRASQLLGTASGGEIRFAIRDNATFMDPRSQQDWWR